MHPLILNSSEKLLKIPKCALESVVEGLFSFIAIAPSHSIWNSLPANLQIYGSEFKAQLLDVPV